MANNIVRLRCPPKPTLLDPYAQIRWMFFQVEREHAEPSAASFRHARNKYVEFLTATNAYYKELERNRRFYLEKYWEADALIRFNEWLLRQDLTSKTRYSVYKRVRQVMDMAYALRLIDTLVYHAPMFKGVPETKQRTAYAKREQDVINAAVARWIDLSGNVLRGYAPSGSGIPYRRKGTSLPISIDGRVLEVAEAAKVFGVDHARITSRLQQGWTPRQALGLDPSPKAFSFHWVINGKEFPSAQAVAKHFGVSAAVIHYRKGKGWTPEEIVGIVPRPKNVTGKARQIVVEEHQFASLKEAAKHYGLKYGVLKQRLNMGWTEREALGLDKRVAPGTKLTVEDVSYDSIEQAAAAYGQKRGTVALRLRKGLTVEQALGIRPITVDRKDDRALLWKFENEYGCNARSMLEDVRRREEGSLWGGCGEKRILKLFVRWGVWPYIDDRLVMPLAVELAMLTGLNVESLKMLEVDSYTPEHQLTGQPVINYRKRRSASISRPEERELHVAMLELENLYLDETVGEKVHRLWQLILAVTSAIRSNAPPELARRLFIFEDVDRSRKEDAQIIVPLDPHGKTTSWYRRFCREEGLYNLFGPRFNFNISRCRPTLATNMVLNGAGLFQVQAALGHAGVQTTARYLDEQQLMPAFNKTVSEALERICRRSLDLQGKEETVVGSKSLTTASGGFCETLSGCGCINPYEPSVHVQRLTHFTKGSICRYWNMCLLCDCSVITEHSLPKLILYRHRVKAALDEDSPSIQARKVLYQDVLRLIDGIIQSDLIFPSEVIETASHAAATMDDILVDQLIY